MSKRQLIILCAALIIIITLFSGLPAFWNKTLYVIIALCIISVAYTTTKPSQNSARKSSGTPYIDSRAVSGDKETLSTPAPDQDTSSTPQA